MPFFDQTLKINAAADDVWKLLRAEIKPAAQIVKSQENVALIFTDRLYGYVYVLRQQSDGITTLRHLVADPDHVRDSFTGGLKEGYQALINAPTPYISQDELSSLKEVGEERLASIKSEAEMYKNNALYKAPPPKRLEQRKPKAPPRQAGMGCFAVAAFAGIFVLGFVLWSSGLWSSLLLTLQGRPTFENGSISVNYGGDWVWVDPSQETECLMLPYSCALVLRRFEGGTTIYVSQYPLQAYGVDNLEALAATIWAALSANNRHLTSLDQYEVRFDGRDGILHEFYEARLNEDRPYTLHVYLLNDGIVTQFTSISYSQPVYQRHRDPVTAVLDTLQFIDAEP
jgi:hypothetical protein